MRKEMKRAGVVAMALMLGVGSTLGISMSLPGPAVVYAEGNEAEETNMTVVDVNTTWKYLDDNSDPAEGFDSLTAWTLNGFDDSNWKSAAGKFGAKKGELGAVGSCVPTVLLNQYRTEYTEDYKNVPTFFFRTTFNVANINEITSITGSLLHDDAVAVYLNGNQIVSVDMEEENRKEAGSGITGTNMYYAGTSGGDPKTATISLNAEQVQSYLIEGDNVLAVELHNDRKSSSDLYMEFTELTVNYNEEPKEEITTQKSVILTMGSDETSRGITWYTNSTEAGEVRIAKKAAMVNGEFPSEYQTVAATSTASNDTGFYSNQAVITGLEANTEYVYCVVNGEMISDVYNFETGAFTGGFSFALVGDPQIGASGNADSDTTNWGITLEAIVNNLDPDFMLSAGDQVNTASSETEYTGYLNSILASFASATTVGNHDSSSAAYGQHFNLPNESTELGTTTAGGDYWFVYNNTLFIGINSNDRSTAEHKSFIQSAINANPDVTWKTVFFHHSIYSTASHWDDSDIITRRNELPTVFDELDIDVVLMGHDHVYTRSYMMNANTPDNSEGPQSEVYNPSGILYLTANSASGSKYYSIANPDADYSAVMDQSKRRTVTDVTVTDNSYTLTTYFADDMSQLDTFTIYKTDKTELEAAITEAAELLEGENEADHTAGIWEKFEIAYIDAKTIYGTEDAKQDVIDTAVITLNEAMEELKADTKNEVEVPDDNGQDNIQNNDNQNNNSQNNGSHDDRNQTGTAAGGSHGPKTGDTTNAAAMGILMFGSAGVIALILKKRREV